MSGLTIGELSYPFRANGMKKGLCPADTPSTVAIDSDCELRSPTLRDLLEYEAEMNVHQRLPRLKDKTAAMGLLWVRRQLHYQTSLFANVVKVPSVFTTVADAITSAYSEVYDKYHGWAVQKIFKYSFQAAPKVEEIYKFMNPHRMKEVLLRGAQMTPRAEQAAFLSPQVRQHHKSAETEDLNPLQQFGEHIVNEWDKFTSTIGGIFNENKKNKEFTRQSASPGLVGQDLDEFVKKEMTQDAHNHIGVYLQTVQGLLSDLATLFKELNMDDPTKV
eukprot:CAMPEP_0116558324 /NCGR_PEP_ID=MMETSP0397-20121206/9746_1 /TAXON_ID=216820 /ORGANISM="Cyclophora tenuis, Strain ECT3854" /LENGTH=274 /DNA_ID=CAMNT_0004083907 /DNA_START=31 /DNA_END=855 /DNA_ORIENTATION=+